MNAISFLKKEHDKVRKTLKEIGDESHRYETKKTMFTALCQELVRHETMEQTVWYPRFKNHEKLDDTVKHLISEEKEAATTIKEFAKVKEQEEWEEKFLEFKDDVEHHASEEEHKLFPAVQKILNEEELEKIGQEMQVFKETYHNPEKD